MNLLGNDFREAAIEKRAEIEREHHGVTLAEEAERLGTSLREFVPAA